MYSEETLLRNYRTLNSENQRRVSEFLFNILYIQRKEQEIEDTIEQINDSLRPERDEDGIVILSKDVTLSVIYSNEVRCFVLVEMSLSP